MKRNKDKRIFAKILIRYIICTVVFSIPLWVFADRYVLLIEAVTGSGSFYDIGTVIVTNLVLAFVITLVFMLRAARLLDREYDALDGIVDDDYVSPRLPNIISPRHKDVEEKIKKELKFKQYVANEAEQRKNDLVVYLAHDLKTPLTSIIGYLSLLDENPDFSVEYRAKYTGIALDKAYRLEQLINEFFDITRFNLQSFPLENNRIDLSLLLRQMAEEFYPVLKEKNLTCTVKAEDKVNIKAKNPILIYILISQRRFLFMARKRISKSMLSFVLITVLLISGVSIAQRVHNDNSAAYSGLGETSDEDKNISAKKMIKNYADENGYTLSDYPQSLVDLLKRNKETKEFVLNYPKYKDKHFKINMKEYKNCDSVPLFMQWDIRWGYKMYGDDVAGLTACGPTCLSMVAVYLLQDIKYSPDYMIDWAKENGYCVDGGGSLWTLMSEGAQKLGIDSTELPLDKQRVINNLEVGNPVVCIMGPGDFTKKGHFIVMTGIENGKIKINDPNSIENSNKLWNFDDISSQINNLWAMRV